VQTTATTRSLVMRTTAIGLPPVWPGHYRFYFAVRSPDASPSGITFTSHIVEIKVGGGVCSAQSGHNSRFHAGKVRSMCNQYGSGGLFSPLALTADHLGRARKWPGPSRRRRYGQLKICYIRKMNRSGLLSRISLYPLPAGERSEWAASRGHSG
jgi:hypothetical protein